jgi:hypothetical protein
MLRIENRWFSVFLALKAIKNDKVYCFTINVCCFTINIVFLAV